MNHSKQKSNPSWWISIAFLLIFLMVTYGADLFLSYLRQRNESTFDLGIAILISRALFDLLLALGLLLLAWLVLVRTPSNPWVAVIYLLIGLFIVFLPLLWLTGLLYDWIFTRSPLGHFLSDFLSTNRMLTYYAGGFVAVIGLFGIIRSSREKTDGQ